MAEGGTPNENNIEDVAENDAENVFNNNESQQVLKENLVSAIQNNNLKMSEIQVWKYVIKWGLAQNPELPSDPAIFSKDDFNVLKNTLQQLIPLIKFNNLTSKEFYDHVLPYKKVLPKELYKDLLKIFLNIHPYGKPNDKKIDSKIITFQHAELISKWIDKLDITDKLTSLYEFKLIFRKSRDGPLLNKFHKICNNRSRTVTIVKVKGKIQILGGYNPIEWKSDRCYSTTKDSFIFSFKNGDDINEHILSRVVNEDQAIFNDHTYGPSFGGADLILRGDSGHCIKDSYEKSIRVTSDDSRYAVKCHYCKYAIFGIIWKCKTCDDGGDDYNLCYDCKPKVYDHKHAYNHEFEPTLHSKTDKFDPQCSTHQGVVCDCCNDRIYGMRWKCAFCQNYDLCQDCKSGISYPNHHIFKPIAYTPSIFKVPVLEPSPVTCKFCKSECTYGVCHKCANGEFSVEEYELFQIVKK